MGSQNSSSSKNQLVKMPEKQEKEINFLNSDLSIENQENFQKYQECNTDVHPKSTIEKNIKIYMNIKL